MWASLIQQQRFLRRFVCCEINTCNRGKLKCTLKVQVAQLQPLYIKSTIGNFLIRKFSFDWEINFFFGNLIILNLKNFSFCLIIIIEEVQEISRVRKPCYFLYLACFKMAFKNMPSKTQCDITARCVYILYLQSSCMAESKTIPEILRFTSFFG